MRIFLRNKILRVIILAFIIGAVIVPALPGIYQESLSTLNTTLPSSHQFAPFKDFILFPDNGSAGMGQPHKITSLSDSDKMGDLARLRTDILGVSTSKLKFNTVQFSTFLTGPVLADSVDLYWVKSAGVGTGSWSQTAHWGTSTGGAGGHAVPTATNKVTFDANSFNVTETMTLDVTASCADMTWATVTNSPTWAGSAALTIYGSFTGGTLSHTFTGSMTFASTTTGKTITSNGVILDQSGGINFNGVGGGWTLVDALNMTNARTLTLTNGSFNTGNQTVTTGPFTTATGTHTLTLGSSTFNCTTFVLVANSTNTTLVANTSNISCSSQIQSLYATGVTFYDVTATGSLTISSPAAITEAFHNLTCSALTSTVTLSAGAAGIMTFNNITLTGTAANTTGGLVLSNNITVAGTLTLTGDSNIHRLYLKSNSIGTPRTITSAANVMTHVDYQDITAAGSASWNFSGDGESIENSGCTGITCAFPWNVNANLYWYVNGAAWQDEYHWSTVSGGSPSGGSIRHALPSATNNVYFDANSFTLGAQSVDQASTAYCHDMIWTGALHNPKFNHWLNYQRIYGSLTFIAAMTIDEAGQGPYSFLSTNSGNTITTAGHIIGTTTADGGFNGAGGEWTLMDTLNLIKIDSGGIYSNGLTLTAGTLHTNGQTIDLRHGWYGTVGISGSTTRTFDVGASTIYCAAWSATTTTNLTYTDVGGTNIVLSPLNSANYSVSFDGGGLTYNGTVTLNMTNSGTTGTITSANTFNNLTLNNAAFKNQKYTLLADQTINGVFTCSGNSQANRLLVTSSTAGTQRTITLNGTFALTNTDFLDLIGAGTNTWDISSTNTGDAGNNTNISFKPQTKYYWYQDSGNWSTGAMWFTQSNGGGSSGTIPLLQDIAIFDGHSFSITTRTVTMDMARIGNIIATEALNGPTFSADSSAIVYFYGDVTFGEDSLSANTGVYFMGRGTQNLNTGSTIDHAGTTFTTPNIYFYNYGSGCLFQSNLITTGNINVVAGLTDFFNHNVTAATLDSYTYTTYVRSLNLGSGALTLNSTAAAYKFRISATNFTLLNNTSNIVLSNSGTNAQTFGGGALTNYHDITVTGIGAYTMSFDTNLTVNILYIDRSSASKTLAGSGAARTITATDFVIPLAGTRTVQIGGGSAATAMNFTLTGGGVIATDYLVLNQTTASPGTLTFYAGSHATNTSSSGWIIGDYATPIVSTLPVSSLNKVSVVLNGSIDYIDGQPTVYVSFDWGPTVSYGNTTPEQSFSGVSTYSQLQINMTPAATYHYRAHLRYGTSTVVLGKDNSFVMHSEPLGTPSVSTVGTTGLTGTSVTLLANLNDLGFYSLVYASFQYGADTNYGASTPEMVMTGAGPITQNVSNLVVGQTYHFRAIIRYATTQTTSGADAQFTSTLSILPVVTTTSALSLTTTGALLTGSVDNMGNSLQVFVSFDYGTDMSYGYYTAEETVNSPKTITGDLSGFLSPNTTYHYRIKARYSQSQYVYGADHVFTTSAIPAPAIITVKANQILYYGATLNCTVTGLGISTVVYISFRYGTTGSYGSTSNSISIVAVGNYSVPVVNLTSNTLYHFNARATYANNLTVDGGDLTFQTVNLNPTITPTGYLAKLTSAPTPTNGTVVSGNPTLPSQMFQEMNPDAVPGFGIMTAIFGVSGTPDTVWFYPFIFIGMGIISLLVYELTTSKGTAEGSLLTQGLVIEVMLVMFSLVGSATGHGGLTPLWTAFLFPLPATALVMSRRFTGWG